MHIDFFKKALCLIIALSSLFACTRPFPLPSPEEEKAPREQTIRLNITPVPQDTKSSYFSDQAYSRLNHVTIYAVDKDNGYWKKAFLRSTDGASANWNLSFPDGHTVDIYVLANMGDVEIPSEENGQPDFKNYTYLLPGNTALEKNGFPMAEKTTLTVGDETNRVAIGLKRLVSKVVVTIDKKALTGSTTPVLLSEILHLRQANRRLRPFDEDGSAAQDIADLFDAPFDSHWFTAVDSQDLRHMDIALYVPENRQQSPELGTYIEFSGVKDGGADGVDGKVTYRGALGSVLRNVLYKATLTLTWDGLIWKADGWSIDTQGITDGRRLVLSTENGSSRETNSLGNLQRKVGKDIFVNFSRDGGVSWVHGAKDIDNWPYGWDLYIDGVKQPGGVAGMAAGAIGWSYDGTSTTDRLRISPGDGAALRSRHTLHVQSADGKIISNSVTFNVGETLGLTWSSGAPEYVAQRGMLTATGLTIRTASVTYTVVSGAQRVRLSQAKNKQSTMVNLMGAGEVTIRATCEASGQEEDITFTVEAPQISLGSSVFYANPDGSTVHTGEDGLQGFPIGASFIGKNGILFRKKTASTDMALGTTLAQDLFTELLQLTLSVDSPILDGGAHASTEVLELHVNSLSSYPTIGGTLLGTVTVGAKHSDTGIEPTQAQVRSVNPFEEYPREIIVNDYQNIQDFSVLGRVLPEYNTWTFSTDYPTTSAQSSSCGVAARFCAEPELDDELSKLFSLSSGKVSWESVTTSRMRRKAGIFCLQGYVENAYSKERMYSRPFYMGQLFLHGAVCARGKATVDNKSRVVMEVFTDYYGEPKDYTINGLGAAWPDVNTRHTDRAYTIEWRWDRDYMSLHTGFCIVSDSVNGSARVTARDRHIFSVIDDCSRQHESNPAYHTCRFMGQNTPGSPLMQFVSSPSSSQVKFINPTLVFIRPAGDDTHTYNQVQGCGFYAMHIEQTILDWIL